MSPDGNPFTNLMSLGGKDSRTGVGPNLPQNPLTFGGPNAGLNTHALFEGDASQTRSDFAIGNNHAFNETLFQRGPASISMSHGLTSLI
jgi:hypothetical protein